MYLLLISFSLVLPKYVLQKLCFLFPHVVLGATGLNATCDVPHFFRIGQVVDVL